MTSKEVKRLATVPTLLVIFILVAAGCAAPTPEVREVVVTQEVEKLVTQEVEVVVTQEVERIVEVEAEKVVLNLYVDAGYADFYKARVVDGFREAYPDIELNYATAKWEELFSKLKVVQESGDMDAGETDVHLIIGGGGSALPAYIKAGLVQEILPKYEAELPNVEKLAPPAQIYLEPWEGYGVPAHVDYYPLLLQNPRAVPDPISDLDSLKAWIQDNPGRFMHGRPARSGPGRTFVLGIAYALGEDLEHPETWSKTWDYLKEIDPYITTYPDGTGDTIRALAGGEVDVIPLGWGWQADLKHFMQIPPDTIVSIEWTSVQLADPHGFVIPKGVPEDSLEAALKFINFELSDEVQALMGEVVHYPATIAGWEAMPDKYKDLTTQLMGGKAFPEFVEEAEFVTLPSFDAMTTLFEEWDNRIGATHEYKGP